MLDEIESKTVKVIDSGKSKTLSVKPIENTSKNPQFSKDKAPVEKEVLLSQKLQYHAYE